MPATSAPAAAGLTLWPLRPFRFGRSREDGGGLVERPERGRHPDDAAGRRRERPGLERLVPRLGRLVLEELDEGDERAAEGGLAVVRRGDGRVHEAAQGLERFGPEARAGELGGHGLHRHLPLIDRVVAPVSLIGGVDRGQVFLEPLASPFEVAVLQLIARHEGQERGERLRPLEPLEPLEAELQDGQRRRPRLGALEGRQGDVAGELGRGPQRVALEALPHRLERRDRRPGGLGRHLQLRGEDGAGEVGHRLGPARLDPAAQVVGLAGAHRRRGQHRAQAPRLLHRRGVERLRVEEELGGASRGHRRGAEDLVHLVVRGPLPPPDPLQRDELGDDLRSHLVGALVEGGEAADGGIRPSADSGSPPPRRPAAPLRAIRGRRGG